MKKSLAVLRRDLLRLLRNPIAAVIALGVCIVPCLYAWINIAANWDPYANTSDIPVAIVNEDTPRPLQDMGEICVGDMLVEALKENDSIDWQFVGRDEAIEAVRAGGYYAAIILPDDFTEHLTGILDGKTEKAHITYYVNEKVNAIAPKVADTGASTIEMQVNEQFIATAGSVITEKLGGATEKLTAGVETAADSLDTALQNARETLRDVDGDLEGLSATLVDAQSSLESAASRLSALDGKGAEVSASLEGALGAFDTTRANAHDLIGRINASLNYGAASILALSSTATYDVSALAGDIAAAQSEIDAAIAALEKDLTDNEALKAKVSRTIDVIASYTPEGSDTATVFFETQDQLSRELDVLVQVSDATAAKIEELRGIVEKIEAASDEVAGLSQGINDKVQSVTGTLQEAQDGAIGTSLLQVSSALDTFVGVAQQLSTASKGIDPVIAQIVTVSGDLANTMGESSGAIEGTRGSLGGILSDMDALSRELALIRSSQDWDLLKDFLTVNPEGVKEFLSAPVQIRENRLYPVENYASSVAPFFTSLALWVGGIAFVAIFKLEVDEEKVGKLRPWQAYLGRWWLLLILGVIQAIVCCTGCLALGIQCAYPGAYYLSAIVASLAFVSVIFSLSSAFKHLGKALAFTLIILQVPGSSGMYPIEMMPLFFRALGPWLPFTYSNNAIREAIAGFYDGNLTRNLLALALFMVPAVLVGITARGRLVNVNALFDRRLRETDHLMVSEVVDPEEDRFSLASVVKAIHTPEEYRELFELRSAAFEQVYPSLVRGGAIALVTFPFVLFALALVVDNKLPLIACLVVFLVLLYAFLIVVEYLHDRVMRKRALTDLTPEELGEVLVRTLRDEALAVASIDRIIERRRERRKMSPIDRMRQRTARRDEVPGEARASVPEGGDEQ